MARSVLLVLAEGFEEVEAVAPIDILRRAGVDVTVASVEGAVVKGAHGIAVQADAELADVEGRDFDMIVLPGGIPGANNLAASQLLSETLKRQRREGRAIAAICASPAVVLYPLGLLEGQKASCYPTFQQDMAEENRTGDRVTVGDKLITAAGPGVALEFGLALAEYLAGREKADELAKGMLVR
ncbi:MAG: DJ-1 family protein [Synergistaceae bacterium]|nr:DJ-1 family protein [Synergistaceae bacterium]